ncbi:hypothetical protein SAMN05880501_101147 [Ureibacillus xyleni]|uniref:Competence protein CoiA-like N-terminal domain-containing protein n=1 Tax=Ureibacillus xyleni TaxID=614648 RepID=A0A285R8B4_9BACL|nr:hypothetical protein [Ureibacillus xyleni]SOB90356.1 hypothetical protein SAMN05880501_101147 [Ureibacillus xyleni]
MYHSIYQHQPFLINQGFTLSELKSYMKIAEKGGFSCPYCGKSLRIKIGSRKPHFYHLHGETCQLSKAADTYERQIQRETKIHTISKEIIFNELQLQSKLVPGLNVQWGFEAKGHENWRYYPDLLVTLGNREIGISIISNITNTKDSEMANKIKKRQNYFAYQGITDIWFYENNERSIDERTHSLYLWEAEAITALPTSQDKKWEHLFQQLSSTYKVTKLYDYKLCRDMFPELKNKPVKSLYYIQQTDEGVMCSVQRFVVDKTTSPYQSFALPTNYSASLASFFTIKDNKLQLCDPTQEEVARNNFIEDVRTLAVKQQRKQNLEKQLQQEALEKILKRKAKEEMEKLELQQKITASRVNKYTYDDLKKDLKSSLNMKQSEQQKLWTKYILRNERLHDYRYIKNLSSNVQTMEELFSLLDAI